MAARMRGRTPPQSPAKRMWDKYGGWVLGAVALVLVVVLTVTLVGRYRQSKVDEYLERLSEISTTHLRQEMRSRRNPRAGGSAQLEAGAALTEQRLRALLYECDYDEVRVKIELRLAQMLLKRENYEEAEELFLKVSENEALDRLERVQTNLGLAYTAMGLGNLEEARARWERVGEDKLYVVEAETNIKLIDRTLERRGKEKTEKAAAE